MKSPFPGMDPYIEAHGYLWEDFHSDLIAGIKAALASALPSHYFAQAGVRSYVVLVEQEEKTDRQFLPNVAIISPGRGPSAKTDSVALAVAESPVEAGFEPVELQAFVAEEFRESFVEIRELEGEQRLVTCIEVLSPSNKRRGSKGWKRFLRKRKALLLGEEANFIEIDLLRGGTKMPMRDPWPTSPYSVLVARSEKAPRCKVWPSHFQRALPAIPVPLESPDPDLLLDLQPLIDAIYERSRYSGRNRLQQAGRAAAERTRVGLARRAAPSARERHSFGFVFLNTSVQRIDFSFLNSSFVTVYCRRYVRKGV